MPRSELMTRGQISAAHHLQPELVIPLGNESVWWRSLGIQSWVGLQVSSKVASSAVASGRWLVEVGSGIRTIGAGSCGCPAASRSCTSLPESLDPDRSQFLRSLAWPGCSLAGLGGGAVGPGFPAILSLCPFLALGLRPGLGNLVKEQFILVWGLWVSLVSLVVPVIPVSSRFTFGVRYPLHSPFPPFNPSLSPPPLRHTSRSPLPL